MAGLDHIISFDVGAPRPTSPCMPVSSSGRSRPRLRASTSAPLRWPSTRSPGGGGSVLHFDGARFRVGPDSAGANPGPASYRRGGPLTVTDANVCVGKIQPAHFPAIFGPDGDQSLDADIVRDSFLALADEVAKATGRRSDIRDVAEGFLRIAVANMGQCRQAGFS
jgi:5-oxoprolinase (ATP-hydrolysing)